MKNNFLDTLILTIIVLGIISSGDLSYREFVYGGTCPKFSIIPSCYIALGYSILLFIFQIFKRFDLLFIIFTSFALAHGIFGSISHIMGTFTCPIFDIGIPACFIALTMFIVLLILKFIQVRVERRS